MRGEEEMDRGSEKRMEEEGEGREGGGKYRGVKGENSTPLTGLVDWN